MWNESRKFGDMAGSLRAPAWLPLTRRAYAAAETRPMIAMLEELGVRDSFDVRAVRRTVG